MSIATEQKLKELERRIAALEARSSAPVVMHVDPRKVVLPQVEQDEDDPFAGDAPPRGLLKRRAR